MEIDMQIIQSMYSDTGIRNDHSAQHGDFKQYKSNHFDDRLDDILKLCVELILNKGVYHLKIHFSSSQLVCWTFDNPYSYQVYTSEEIFSDNFMDLFAPLNTKLHSCIDKNKIIPILESFKYLRCGKEGSELRNASIHIINGYIGLTFSCDDTRYINFKNYILPDINNN